MRYLLLLIVSLLVVSYSLANSILTHSVEGYVYRGNFSYWSLTYSGHIKVILITSEGDTDLYVAENNRKPTYEPDKYDLHSASCGIDSVEIPASFQRPVGIGIYGHPSHENSTYLLEVYYDVAKSHEKDFFAGNQLEDIEEENENAEVESSRKESVKKFRVKTKIVASFWAMLEIFELLFL